MLLPINNYMLLDVNGKPYRAVGDIQQFDPENPEHNLFNLWDEEAIRKAGSPIFYYEVFIQKGTIDPIYVEDRGKIWSNTPIELFAIYDPIPSQNAQTMFGIDSPDEMIFQINYKSALRTIGHPPKVGSRIHTPHLREDWRVVQRNLGEFKLWGALRLELICSKFQESTTTGEGKVTQKKPDFTIN